MALHILENIPFEIDIEKFYKDIHIGPNSEDAETVRAIVAMAEDIGRPKAVYREAFIESRGEDFVIIDRVRINSRILRVNTDGEDRVFPYVATCGSELFTWAQGLDDILERYWADLIMERALYRAIDKMNGHIGDYYGSTSVSVMNPGSLEDWPLGGQPDLLGLLGDVEGMIDVSLTDSYLMVPFKTTSGLIFSASSDYSSCMLCGRENCPKRRAPYDADLYDKKYGSSSKTL
ncbi:MAG TPA: vitamin B12 dependent methionine synthase [Bacillota bacterium]|nr:vitamin B12 dependent methionine synthase [Bacillota bacterium]